MKRHHHQRRRTDVPTIVDETSLAQVQGSNTSAKWRNRTEFVGLTALGTLLGVLLFAHGTIGIGPLRAELSLVPNLSGGTVIGLGPLGEIGFASHQGVIAVDVDVHSMAPSAAEAFVTEGGIDRLARTASADLRAGFRTVAMYGALGAASCSMLLVLVAYRRWRAALFAGAGSLLIITVAAGAAYLSFEPKAITQPEYRGLVSAAPKLIGSAKDIAENFGAYRDQMGRLLANVTQLYAAGNALPDLAVTDDTVTVLHVSDIHLNPQAWDMIERLVDGFDVAIVVDSGDISDHGTRIEDPFYDPVGSLGVPYVFVRGNHDSYHTAEVLEGFDNVRVLDGGTVTLEGLVFAGFGDPRFTPDKTTRTKDGDVATATALFAEKLRAMGLEGQAPQIVVVHDGASASLLDGLTPLVLSGHYHHRSTAVLPAGTRTMVQGSTGGSGLRALSKGDPDPLEATLLHIDRKSGELVAWDDVTMSGLGLASVQISRHLPE